MVQLPLTSGIAHEKSNCTGHGTRFVYDDEKDFLIPNIFLITSFQLPDVEDCSLTIESLL